MPIAEIQLPDGRVAEIEVPKGATDEQITQFAKSQFSSDRTFPEYYQGASSQSPVSMGLGQSANTTRQAIEMGAAPKPTEGKPTGFMAGFKSGFVRDPETKLRVLAEQIFPGDPEAVKRFGIIDGKPVYIDDAGNPVDAISGMMAKTGEVVSNLPEAIGATVGSLATGNPYTGAVIGDVGGRAVKQGIGSLVFDEPQTAQGNIVDLAKEGALATTGAFMGKVGTMFGNRRAVKGLDKLNLDSAIAVQDRIKKATGIDLDVAQASKLTGMKSLRKWVMKYPSEAAEVMDNFSKLQNGQSQEAVEGILNSLSKKTNLAQLGESSVNAAKAAIEVAKKEREDLASPLYKKAFASGAKVDAKPIINEIDKMLSVAKGPVRNDLLAAKNHFYKNVKKQTDDGFVDSKVLDDTIEGLHNTKIAIDAMLAKRAGATAAENQSLRQLVNIKNDLVESLAKASPDYDAGRLAFEKASKELVNPLENSPVGAIAKLNNQRLAKAASQLFSNTPNVESIKHAKRVIQGQDKQAWNDLVRQKLQTELERAMEITQTGEVVNLQGKFLKNAAGTKSKREALEAALDGDIIDTAGDVLEAFELIANSPIGGSDTAFNLAITEQQKQTGATLISKAMTPIKSIADAVDSKFLDRHSMAIAEALTNPRKIKQVRKLLELPKGLERSIQIASVILPTRGGEKSLDVLMPQPDILPPIQAQQ